MGFSQKYQAKRDTLQPLAMERGNILATFTGLVRHQASKESIVRTPAGICAWSVTINVHVKMLTNVGHVIRHLKTLGISAWASPRASWEHKFEQL